VEGISRFQIPRNSLIILIGPAGSGKSRFASKHFKSTEIVSSDECRALIADDASDQSVSRFAFELLYHIVDLRLSLGRLTVVDATNLTIELRNPLLRIARKRGFNTVAILFDVDVSTCIERNQRRARRVPESAIIQQHSIFQDALRAIHLERLNQLFVLNEEDQDKVAITIGNALNLRPEGPAA